MSEGSKTKIYTHVVILKLEYFFPLCLPSLQLILTQFCPFPAWDHHFFTCFSKLSILLHSFRKLHGASILPAVVGVSFIHLYHVLHDSPPLRSSFRILLLNVESNFTSFRTGGSFVLVLLCSTLYGHVLPETQRVCANEAPNTKQKNWSGRRPSLKLDNAL